MSKTCGECKHWKRTYPPQECGGGDLGDCMAPAPQWARLAYETSTWMLAEEGGEVAVPLVHKCEMWVQK
jgi:hypothetical protein